MSETSRYVNDPKADKWITWGLTSMAGVSFAVGAWFFQGLNDTQKELTKAVSGLRTEVAVLQTQQGNMLRLHNQLQELKSDTNSRITKLWDAVTAVRDEQSRRTGNVYRVEQIAKELAALEASLANHANDPHHKDAGRQITSLERRIAKLEEK